MDSRADEAISLLEEALEAAGALTARPEPGDTSADLKGNTAQDRLEASGHNAQQGGDY